MGRVQLQPFNSFANLVARLPVQTVGVSRETYHGLPADKRNRLKQTDYLVPSVFRATPSARTMANAVSFCLLFLDVDNHDDAAKLMADPADLARRLDPWSFFAYETASSTPSVRRCRICVHAAGLEVRHYRAAVVAVGSALGLSAVTSESKVAVQPMYLPSIFEGEEGVLQSILFAYRVDGAAFSAEDLRAAVQPKSPEVECREGDVRGDEDEPRSALLDLPDPNVTAEKATELLRHIDPDLERHEWIRVGAALKHQFGDDGLPLWDEWSQEGTKYQGIRDLENQWRSLDRFPEGVRPVKIGTVFMLAKAGGWVQPRDFTGDLGAFVEVCFRENQAGDARLFSELGGEAFIFNHTSSRWLQYSSGVWRLDQTGRARSFLSDRVASAYTDQADQLRRELLINIRSENWDGAGLKGDPRAKHIEALLKRGAELKRRRYLDDVLNLAEDKLPCVAEDFDREPNRMNVRNGTLDLVSGELKAHSPADRFIKQAPIDYLPDAQCPQWVEFVRTIFHGDDTLVAFVRRVLGYCLTGNVDHDYLIYCFGGGRNGKSTFFDVLERVFGDYSVHLPIEAILHQGAGRRDSLGAAELMRLHGARLVRASEIPQLRALNESTVKDITGGDNITARALYCQPFTFAPTHKLFLVGNHKLEIKGGDEGIWRRIYLLPFTHEFPKSGEVGFRERGEVVEEMCAESSGILNWLMEGLRDINKNGLRAPESVRRETDLYRSESDSLLEFLADRCVESPDQSTAARDLWSAYTCWVGHERAAYNSQRQLTAALDKKGFQIKRSNQGNRIAGLVLVDEVVL